ncbi:MAG: TonB-dependent receptor [Caulobacteraceae bacterium]|jgi:iron complex outermembrane receptor protein
MRIFVLSGLRARKDGLRSTRMAMPKPGTACVLSILLAAPLAVAAAEPPEGGGTTLGEVVVTAQKRSQDVQKIGVAVSTMSGKEMETLRIQQPLDLAYLSPSLSTMNATTDSTPLFLIRGVGLDDFNTNNSSGVGTYLDGVFASFPGFLTEAMYDVDRVEILKGPQGTLYGKNTAGGAINIISRQPTDDFEGYVDADYSRRETLDLTAAVSGPLTDNNTARLAGTMTRQGEGYQTDIDTGQKYGKLNRGGGRLLVDFKLNPRVSLQISLHAVYDDSLPSSPSTPNVEALVPSNLPFPTTGLLDSPPGGTLVRVGGLPLYKHEIGDGASANLNVQFNGFALTSITAWDYFTDHSLDNYDGYPAADNNWTKNYQQWQFSQEVRLASTTAGPVDWIVGADFSQNWYRCRDALDWTFVYGLADSITDSGKAITAANFTQTQMSEGLFAHADTHLSSQWTLVTGLRYSHDEVAFVGETVDPTGLLTYAANNFTGPIIPNTILAALDQSRSSQNVSFRAEVDYRPTSKILIYASAASGYKGGVFYGQPAQVQADWGYVAPETELTLELGVKSRFLHDSIEFDAAVFDTDIRNRQSSLSLWSGPVGTQPLIAGLGNLPRSRIDGAEGDFEWRPISGLEVNLAATYVYGRVTETLTNENGLALFTPVVAGQMLPDAPKFDGSWTVRYEHPISAKLTAYVQANDHYVGAEHPYLGDPTTFGQGDDLGARFGIRNPAQHWDASLWGTNLTDDRHLTYAFAGSEGERVSFYQKPRSLGVNLTYTF